MHRSIIVRSDRARRLSGDETGRIEVQERIARRGSDRMSYKVTAVFYPDREFWSEDEEYPDEEPYSWTEQKDFESLEEADAWVTNRYVVQDLAEYFAAKGLRIQIASDLDRDGIALEVLRENEELAAKLFYSDADDSLTVTQVNHSFLAEDFQLLISTAKRRLIPTNTEQGSAHQSTTAL